MASWVPVPPELPSPHLLPEHWEVLHDPSTGHYAVVGSTSADQDQTSVIVRIDFGVSQTGHDIRPYVGHAVAQCLRQFSRRANQAVELEDPPIRKKHKRGN